MVRESSWVGISVDSIVLVLIDLILSLRYPFLNNFPVHFLYCIILVGRIICIEFNFNSKPDANKPVEVRHGMTIFTLQDCLSARGESCAAALNEGVIFRSYYYSYRILRWVLYIFRHSGIPARLYVRQQLSSTAMIFLCEFLWISTATWTSII